MDPATWVQILNKAFGILHWANTPEKVMNLATVYIQVINDL